MFLLELEKDGCLSMAGLPLAGLWIMYQASKEDIHLRVSRIFFMRYVTISPALHIKTAEMGSNAVIDKPAYK